MGYWLYKRWMSYSKKCNIFRLSLTVGSFSLNLFISTMSDMSGLCIKGEGIW